MRAFFFFFISLCSLMWNLQHRLHLTDHKIQHVWRHKPLQVMGFQTPRCHSHVVADGAARRSALNNSYSHPVIWSARSITAGSKSNAAVSRCEAVQGYLANTVIHSVQFVSINQKSAASHILTEKCGTRRSCRKAPLMWCHCHMSCRSNGFAL